MPDHLKTGRDGEKLAADFLLKKGYSIIHTNWKDEGCEIDIIATHNNKCIFVEVKTRSRSDYGWPEKAVTAQKIKNIVRAAESFIYRYKIDTEIRFDIISVINQNNKPEIYHIEDAFVP